MGLLDYTACYISLYFPTHPKLVKRLCILCLTCQHLLKLGFTKVIPNMHFSHFFLMSAQSILGMGSSKQR